MKLLLLLASLLSFATPHAHARISQGIVNSASDKLDTIMISVFGRQPKSPPPSPFPSPTKHQSSRGNTSPCDNDTTNTYNSHKFKCLRAHDHTISSPPPPPPAMAAERNKPSPPPPPKGPGGIIPLRMRTPSALCMPGRPCAAGGYIM